MSEEFYEHVREEYLETLYDEDTGDPLYRIARSELYQELRGSTNVTNKDAVQISRLLEKGKVNKVDERIEELLV